MNGSAGKFHNIFQRRNVYIGIVLLLILAITLIGKSIHLSYLEKHWEGIKEKQEHALHANVVQRFDAYQQETLQLLGKITDSELFQYNLFDDTSRFVRSLALQQWQASGYTLEVYDNDKQLACWAGSEGVAVDTSRMQKNLVSYVSQGPIYAYYIVSKPITDQHTIVGYAVVKRLFDVNYPMNNRFINNRAFTSSFASRLSFFSRYIFSETLNAPDSLNSELYVELRGMDSSRIGYAVINKPVLATTLEEMDNLWTSASDILLFILCVQIIFFGIRRSMNAHSRLMVFIIPTFGLWFLRYAMVWMNVPARFMRSELFDPTFFASTFGFGLARSLGDVFLSSLTFLVNVIMLYGVWHRWNQTTDRQQFLKSKIVTIIVTGIAAIAFTLFLRGCLETVRSGVFDSTLVYNDPAFVFPSLPLSVMFISLWFLLTAIVVSGVLLISYAFKALRLHVNESSVSKTIAGIAAMFTVSFIVVQLLYVQPLINPIEYAGILFLIGIIAWYLDAILVKGKHNIVPKAIILSSLIAVGILIIRLDQETHAHDRADVEMMASEVTRPVDAWLTFVVNRALDEFSSSEIAATIAEGNPQDIQKLAFTGWAKSILSTEGYNCYVSIVDNQSEKVSDFRLGGIHVPDDSIGENLAMVRNVTVQDVFVEGVKQQWYSGYTPIYSETGVLIGGVYIGITANDQTFFKGDSPEIFRNYTNEHDEVRHREVIVTEYLQGKAISSSSEAVPRGRQLSPDVRTRLRENTGVWIQEKINSNTFESYAVFIGSPGNGEKIFTLSIEEPDIRWHIFSIARSVSFFITLLVVIAVVFYGIQRLRGLQPPMHFRTKLLLAFTIVSLIPIIVLAYSNKEFAQERAEANIARRLHDETQSVEGILKQQLRLNKSEDINLVNNDLCASIASTLGIDFNFYARDRLIASSKPELVVAEVIDPRLDAEVATNFSAYRGVFFTKYEFFGSYPYLVGYRAVKPAEDSIRAVISIPTLLHQQEVDDDLVQRNTFLFGAYVVAMIIAVIVGLVFSNQISSPVRRMHEATQQIAAGNLSIQLSPHPGDELGELEQSLAAMASDLQQAQQEMMKTQRELAWKEMAKQVAHEIKNPLTPMKLSLQHLRQAFQDNARDFGEIFIKVSDTLLEQIEVLNRIAVEFAHFARMPNRTIKECNVHDILHEAVNLFQQYEGITFHFALNAKWCYSNADQEELRRAFINIIRNSIQAMKERGAITIATSLQNLSLEIKIKDTGPGIPQEIQHRLFEPNFSTKTEGMGLGLSIVKKTIDDIGGTITIVSEGGNGTTVILSLPIIEQHIS